MSFVSEPIEPVGGAHPEAGPADRGPAPPIAFRWRDEIIEIATIVRTWQSTKDDRGDTYLKRHWFETTLRDGRTAVVYFDRAARRGSPPWRLYTLD
jgi:hypothetical protein